MDVDRPTKLGWNSNVLHSLLLKIDPGRGELADNRDEGIF